MISRPLGSSWRWNDIIGLKDSAMTPKARLLQFSSDPIGRLHFNVKWRSRAFLTAAVLFILAHSSPAGLLAAELPRVPAGFTITRVTTPELVQHPTMACFDDRGRLYVCESA